MGKLDKHIFSQYVEYECERQLLINIGKEDDRWIQPLRKLIPLTRLRKSEKYALKLGKEYEQEVYEFIKVFPEAKYSLNPEERVVTTLLSPDILISLYQELQNTKTQAILLEHHFKIPKAFLQDIFNTSTESQPVIADSLRPDIIVAGFHQGEIRELAKNNVARIVPEKELNVRIGLTLVDIKVANEDSISKKQLIELVYYCITLRSYLEKNNLLDKFYVKINGNGILPNIQKPIFRSISDIQEKIVPMKWEETWRLYAEAIKTINRLWANAPQPIESTEVNIHSACGRCNYLEDCKSTLGCNENTISRDWDLRLLPNTSRSIVEQLLQKGFKTIGDVADNIGNIRVGNTPEALYPVLPILDLKSKAIAIGDEVVPEEGMIHSVAIPRYHEMSLIFNLESDPIYQRAIGIGLYFSIFVSSNLSKRSPGNFYNQAFHQWWRIWKQHLEGTKDVEQIIIELNEIISFEISEFNGKKFSKALHELKVAAQKFEIILPGDMLANNEPSENTLVAIEFTTVNGGHKDHQEREFAKKVVQVLYNALLVADYIEQYLRVEIEEEERKTVYGPVMA
ncbi:MAG: hypothetical protein ACXAD7_15265, partial [Candidatus Kariarchaeaceae archaeon]